MLFQEFGELLNKIALFPRHAQILASHVAVCGELSVDRTAQIESLDDRGGPEVDVLEQALRDQLLVHFRRAESLHENGGRSSRQTPFSPATASSWWTRPTSAA